MTMGFIADAVLPIALLLAVWIVAPVADAADKAPRASAPAAKPEEQRKMPSETADDTREACLARIPKDATPGQRMVAEHTCKRDQESRQPIQDVPGR